MPDNPNPQQPQLESVRSEKFTKLYSNSAQIDVNPWDFTLTFGELKRSGAVMQIEQIVAIVMSPQHAKAMLGILTTNVQEYEKQVGEIKLPQQTIPSPAQPKTPTPLGFKSTQ